MRTLYFDTFAYVPSVCGDDDTNAGCMPPATFYRALLDLHLEWKATAIGKNFANAKTFLEKRYTDEMELEDAIHVALLTLKEGFEGELTEGNIEVGIIGDQTDRKFRILTPEEVKDYLNESE